MSQLDAITQQLGSGQMVTLVLDAYTAFTVASALQLSLRHPDVAGGPLESCLVEVIHVIGAQLGGAVEETLADGFNPDKDVPHDGD